MMSTVQRDIGTRASIIVLAVFLGIASLGAQPAESLHDVLEKLGDFDYDVRSEASRTLRRADPETAIPLLREAIQQHSDTYVQFRAAVLLYGFEGRDARTTFVTALDSSNDRVRAAAYEFFEEFPAVAIVPRLLAALETETSEFVRPYLVRALAAADDTREVRERLVRDIDEGQGYFRGAVIEALGDYRAGYAVEPLLRIARDDGPLRDDALLALGKIGDERAVDPLGRIQSQAEDRLQPVVSAAACLLQVDCEGQVDYIINAIAYATATPDDSNQELLRAAATALAALAATGDRRALTALFDAGASASESVRAPVAIALGTVAFRTPSVIRDALRDTADNVALHERLLLVRDAFDLLDEDFAEERFYVLMRGDYWGPDATPTDQAIAETAIDVLEF